MPYVKICPNCGRQFSTSKKKQIYCSVQCARACKRQPIRRRCIICGGQLEISKRSPNRRGINTYRCLNCGEEQWWDRYKGIMRIVERIKHFCRACKMDTKFLETHNRRALVCSKCNKIFFSTTYGFCYETIDERNREYHKRHNKKAVQRRAKLIPILAKRDTNGKAECVECGAPLTAKNTCIDHIVPLPLSWSSRKHTRRWTDNLELLCHSCNIAKGYNFDHQFMGWIWAQYKTPYEDWFKQYWKW